MVVKPLLVTIILNKYYENIGIFNSFIQKCTHFKQVLLQYAYF